MNAYMLKNEGCNILVTYMNGTLKAVEFVAINSEEFELCKQIIPYEEKGLLALGDYEIKKIENTQNTKIRLWCKLYQDCFDINYHVSKAEAGMIKNVEVSELLVNTFLDSTEWWAKRKTISDYVRNYNAIAAIAYKTGKQTNPGNSRQNGNNADSLGEAFQRRFGKG